MVLMIRLLLASVAASSLLAGCAESSKVRVTTNTTAPKVQTAARSEPIFYNGQHYQVDYRYNDSDRAFDIRVKGTSRAMKSDDRKSAVEIATSAVRHFACPTGMTGSLTSDPAYASGIWTMQARCA
jgi:hypothetical protein